MPDAAQGACLDPPADLDGSGDTNVVDVQCGIVTALVLLAEDGSEMPSCLAGSEETADVDCGGGVDVVDIIIIIQYVLGLPIDTALEQSEGLFAIGIHQFFERDISNRRIFDIG